MKTLLLLLVSFNSLAATRLDFQDLESLVKNRNKKVSASVIELRGMEQRTGYLKRSFIPTGEAWVGQERFKTGNFGTMTEPLYSLRANLNLYRGGRDSLEENSRMAQKNNTAIQSEQVYQEELFEVRELYWNLIYYREIYKLYEDARKKNEVNLDRAKRRVSAGLATSVDSLEFEISETQLNQDLARITVSMATLQRRISAVIGLDPETLYETIEEIPHDHADQTPSLTMDFNLFRDVRLEMTNSMDFEARGKIAKRWWTPSFDLYGESILYNYRERTFNKQNDQVDNALGFRLSFNFDGLQMKYDGQALEAKSQASKLRAEQIKMEAEAAFNTAKQELALLHDLIHVGEKNVSKGAEYLRRTQEEYSRGVKNSPDVLSANLKQLEFRRRFAELRRDYAIAKAQIGSLMASSND